MRLKNLLSIFFFFMCYIRTDWNEISVKYAFIGHYWSFYLYIRAMESALDWRHTTLTRFICLSCSCWLSTCEFQLLPTKRRKTKKRVDFIDLFFFLFQ
ncbi:hypothetical protein CW304_18160 [Bacillus sp. UFRGS-B20]|nr:hypothetical protein CW304_18160 [Bacillus sp. UFRGS-B20]